jgi:hypothetical protein
MSRKAKFALYLPPEKKAEIERVYQQDGSRSVTAFIERAVDFYIGYLKVNSAGVFLPAALKSYVDGRLGMLENRMGAMLFKQAVEVDMCASILADCVQMNKADLHQQREQSEYNVRRTNGQLSFEQHANAGDEEWLG